MRVSTQPLPHADFTTDMQFDYFGQRLATGSQDHLVRVFRKSHEEWVLEGTLSGHKGSIVSLSWANPDFGSLLASCALDRTVIIWEEWSSTSSAETRWKKIATLGERDAIVAVAFAPKHVGLRVATCSNDGWIRIYQAVDSVKQQWSLRESFRESDELSVDASCMAWNSYPYDRLSLVVGSVDPPRAALWSFSESRKKWRMSAVLSGHVGGVNHVAWASNMGRSFHLVATASSDCTAKIWSIRAAKRVGGDDDAGDEKVLGGEDDDLKIECIQTLEHPSEVWRVEWNVTGTVLATSCEDSLVRLFEVNSKGVWEPTSVSVE